jgi:hypothetical protein
MAAPARGTPTGEAAFDALPVTVDPLLADVVRLFSGVPPRHRENLVSVVRLLARMLGSGDEAGGRER